MDWLQVLGSTLLSTLRDVVPIVAVILGFQLFVLRESIAELRRLLIGFGYVLLGLTLFLLGLETALFPLGKLMAAQLTHPQVTRELESAALAVHWSDYYWVYVFALALGFSTALAEPAVIAVAMRASDLSGGAIGVWGLRIAVALGAAVGIALGTHRIVTGTPLHYYIIAGYVVVLVQTYFAPRVIIALAYDAGGVTTSTVTVPLVAALGLGLADHVPGRSPLLDGFGLIAFACLFPIMSVMGYAQLAAFRGRRAARRRARGRGDVGD